VVDFDWNSEAIEGLPLFYAWGKWEDPLFPLVQRQYLTGGWKLYASIPNESRKYYKSWVSQLQALIHDG
jgi:hypothetical protein